MIFLTNWPGDSFSQVAESLKNSGFQRIKLLITFRLEFSVQSTSLMGTFTRDAVPSQPGASAVWVGSMSAGELVEERPPRRGVLAGSSFGSSRFDDLEVRGALKALRLTSPGGAAKRCSSFSSSSDSSSSSSGGGG